MGIRQRIQDATISGRGRKHLQQADPAIYEGGISVDDIKNQEQRAADEDGGPHAVLAGHQLVAPETIAPRTEAELDRHIDLSPAPEHKMTTSYTMANTQAALKEAFRILAGPEQLAILSNIVLTEAGVVAKQAVSPEGLRATRLTAKEAFAGTYDAVEEKWLEWYSGFPKGLWHVAVLGGIVLSSLLLGVLLAVWRFVLFGLR